ncbi:hatching enzyme 1.2-like [Montipora capricornis]|uniref:hatching enzyme 1.2-like n=1 Tax=Montipora capricornis TaxID=246305 RepID=UPI0035F1DC25
MFNGPLTQGKGTQNMSLKLVLTLLCFRFVESRSLGDERNDWSVHGHIVRVNEAQDDSQRRGLGDIPLEEEIVVANGDPYKRPGCELFEGDLCLDPEDEAVVKETDLKRNVILNNAKKLWPRKEVRYSVDHNLKNLRPKINDAIALLQDKTCLTFQEVDQSYTGDHIKMFQGNGCWSKIGRSGGAQSLSLGRGCEYVGVVLHEVMHALGIWHEQSRHDRDKYVEVLWNNIQPGARKNFKKYDHGKVDSLGLPYDFDSVMHYDRYLFSIDGKKPTIIARGRPWVKLGGQLRGTLTKNDIFEINALYDCNP